MIPIQNFSSGVLAGILRRQPACQERTAFAWQLVVGPAIARATTVELDRGVLTVHARDGRWLREIERNRPAVLARLQQLLGKDQVTKLSTG